MPDACLAEKAHRGRGRGREFSWLCTPSHQRCRLHSCTALGWVARGFGLTKSVVAWATFARIATAFAGSTVFAWLARAFCHTNSVSLDSSTPSVVLVLLLRLAIARGALLESQVRLALPALPALPALLRFRLAKMAIERAGES